MASRLSEYALKEVYDSGLRGLPWKTAGHTASLRKGGAPDLRQILASPDAEAVVQALEPLDLYRAIKTQGIEDLLDVLPLISVEQNVRLMDYEAWNGQDLVPEKAFGWLKLFREVSHEEFFGRFKTLDEEYQLALLNRFLSVIDIEAHDKLGSAEQDEYIHLPCNELLYKIDTDSPQTREFIDGLIQAGLMVDLPYTYSLITHASFMPPNEDELRVMQFRKARLEEDGFIDIADARAIFVPLSTAEAEQLRARYPELQSARRPLEGPMTKSDDRLLVDCALELIAVADDHVQRLAHCVNTVAAAAGVGPDELQSLDQVVLLVKSVLSLALDDLSGGDVQRAASVLNQEHPTQLLRYGFALAQAIRIDLSERLANSGMRGMEQLPRMVRSGRLGEVMLRLEQNLLTILGLDSVEYMKGVFNRFPMGAKRPSSAAEGASLRIVFEPVHSLAGLRRAAAQVEGILEEVLALREKMFEKALDYSKVDEPSFEMPRVQ